MLQQPLSAGKGRERERERERERDREREITKIQHGFAFG